MRTEISGQRPGSCSAKYKLSSPSQKPSSSTEVNRAKVVMSLLKDCEMTNGAWWVDDVPPAAHSKIETLDIDHDFLQTV